MSRDPVLLATGATGLVMSHVVRCWLDAHPEGRAVAVDLNPPDAAVSAFFQPVSARLEPRVGDVRDADFWDGIARDFAVSHLVHGAAVTSINRMTIQEDGSPDLAGALPALDVNIMGTLRVLAWAARQPNLQRCVTVSSGSVYGPEGPSPLPEDVAVEPDGLYGISKYVGELYTGQAARQFALPALAVRLSGVYGPLDRDTGVRAVTSVPGTLLRTALAGEELRLSGLEARGDYIQAGDVGRAIVALLDCASPSHEIYNIAYGETASLRELAELVTRLVPGAAWRDSEPEEAHLSLDAHPAGGRWGAYDISRLRDDCGWRPRPLEEALAEYRDWLRTQPY
jgi:nucleoside-diphosphate-sugar epimerase